MKRLLLLTILIGLLFTSPNSFAQSSKPKRATIKYENGVKYVGEIRKGSPKKYSEYALIQKIFIGRKKLKHGKGIMYFANGDQLDGEWYNDQCKRGTYKFAYGDIFEGEISESSIQNGKMIFSSGLGTMIFASEGDITLGYKIWHYPANCSFTGTIKDKKPYTGTFDCTLTTKDGDSFTGRLSDGHFGYGKIEYASGDTFEGNFISDTPSSGKYRYASITEITRANHKWEIPAGCVFEGNIVPFTGTVNMEITDAARDKFIGRLKNGVPDEGTMVFAATGHTETGKWKDGLSPREYRVRQQQLDSITKVQAIIQKKKDIERFEKYIQTYAGKSKTSIMPEDGNNLLPGAAIKLSQLFIGKTVVWDDKTYTCEDVQFDRTKYCIIIRCSNQNGEKILYSKKVWRTSNPNDMVTDYLEFNYPEELSTTFYYCDAHPANESYPTHRLWLAADKEIAYRNAKNYYTNKYGKYGIAVLNRKIELGMTVEMVQEIKGKGNISQYVSEGRKITVLSYGGVRNALIATVVSPVNTYTFVNGRLTEYTTNEGQGTVIWN